MSRLLHVRTGSILIGLWVLLIADGCSSGKTDRDAATISAPAKLDTVNVWLIPLDDFNYEEAVLLARALSGDLALNVRATLNMGAAGLTPFPGTTQFSAEDISAMAIRVIPNLSERRPDTAYIVLTQRDINTRDRSLRFNFAVHNKGTRVAVVSIARLVINQTGGVTDVRTMRKRLFKMTKRNIGDVYYGYTRSTDIRDVMYSPIMSLDDVDRMGTEFMGVKRKE